MNDFAVLLVDTTDLREIARRGVVGRDELCNDCDRLRYVDDLSLAEKTWVPALLLRRYELKSQPSSSQMLS